MKIRNSQLNNNLIDIFYKHEINVIKGRSNGSFLGISNNSFIGKDVYFNPSHIEGVTDIYPFDIEELFVDLIDYFMDSPIKYYVGKFKIWVDDGNQIRIEG